MLTQERITEMKDELRENAALVGPFIGLVLIVIGIGEPGSLWIRVPIITNGVLMIPTGFIAYALALATPIWRAERMRNS